VSIQCVLQDSQHNNVVTAGGNRLETKPKTATTKADKGTVTTTTCKQILMITRLMMIMVLVRRRIGTAQQAYGQSV
jgi:hypothetical protein